MMNKQSLIFDEKKYPITWRFNSVDCSLSDEDKHKIIFLIQDESKKLWDSLFPFNNLMEIKENYFLLAEKKILILMKRIGREIFLFKNCKQLNY
ncbi:hypothetical protein [Acinetobacter baumannii]|uniref:hypothetical protein n=2 Tax=Acinetobacter baumannii TaxID=470 RepID=UPI003B4365A1